jgi:hypothetical protein
VDAVGCTDNKDGRSVVNHDDVVTGRWEVEEFQMSRLNVYYMVVRVSMTFIPLLTAKNHLLVCYVVHQIL